MKFQNAFLFYCSCFYCFLCLLASDQCDWPDSVDCNLNLATVKKLTKPTYLYMTFDDGPNEGTPNVLKALQVSIYTLKQFENMQKHNIYLYFLIIFVIL